MPFLISRRLVEGTLVILLASFVTFSLFSGIPGDAAQVLVGDAGSQEDIETVRKELGLDQPLLYRYFLYLKDVLLKQDLGRSLISGRPVVEIVLDKFKNTLMLSTLATGLGVFGGISLGIIAARNRDNWVDICITGILSITLAIPSFLLALILVWLFSLKLMWFPVTGGNGLRFLILPCVTLAVPIGTSVARLTRACLVDAAGGIYVLTAKAKGVPPGLIWRRHIFRNALIPILHFTGVHFGHLLGGAFIIETLFGWPGLGRQMVLAIMEHDYPVITASAFLLALGFQIIHFSLDLIHRYIDPRISNSMG